MKKVLFILICIVILVGFKIFNSSFLEFSDSLADGEVAITFVDDSLLLIQLKNERFLFSLEDNVSESILKKYHLNEVPIYRVSEKPVIDGVDILYQDDSQFAYIYESRKFCVGHFYDCDFTYLYKTDSYIDADIYFYNEKTRNLLGTIDGESYFIKPPISILWSQKNYVIVTH